MLLYYVTLCTHDRRLSLSSSVALSMSIKETKYINPRTILTLRHMYCPFWCPFCETVMYLDFSWWPCQNRFLIFISISLSCLYCCIWYSSLAEILERYHRNLIIHERYCTKYTVWDHILIFWKVIFMVNATHSCARICPTCLKSTYWPKVKNIRF